MRLLLDTCVWFSFLENEKTLEVLQDINKSKSVESVEFCTKLLNLITDYNVLQEVAWH